MKKSRKNNGYRRLFNGLAAALTCNTKLHVTLCVYFGIAVLLLVYVSSQVYTSVLAQNITTLEQERQSRKEALNKLTSEYISMSSRARVSHYCESVLGMHPANEESFERFVIDDRRSAPGPDVEFTHGLPQLADLYRYTLLDNNGKSGR